MYLELRTWKGSWFGGESAIHTRAFGHPGTLPREVFGFAAGLRRDPPAPMVRPLTVFTAFPGEIPTRDIPRPGS
jgi:hypothetical protein